MTTTGEAFAGLQLPVNDPYDRDPSRIAAETLAYPALAGMIAKFEGRIRAAERVFLRNEPDADPLVDENAATQLARYYLMATALRIQQQRCSGAPERDPTTLKQVTDRFTEASIELHGAPDPSEAGAVAARQLQTFDALAGRVDDALLGRVKGALESLRGNGADAGEIAAEQQKLEKVQTALHGELRRRYGWFFDSFQDGPEVYTAAELANKIDFELIPMLAHYNPRWIRWAVDRRNTSNLSADAPAEAVVVGMKRADLPRLEAFSVSGHELLGHGERAVNGRKTGDENIKIGLAGLGPAEEGVSVLIEFGLTGLIPEKIVDRYIDVSLALGAPGRPALSRPQLFDIASARAQVRLQAAGKPVNEAALEPTIWEHVNRTYRGTRGDDIIGVFTKDIAYYVGFKKMVDFVYDRLERGTPIDKIVDTLLFGRIDPTNPSHRDYVAQRDFQIV